MKIFYVLICFSISFYFLRIIKNKIRIKKQFDIYFSSLKDFEIAIDKPNETKIILDKISINGFKLITFALILLVPYLFCSITLFGLLKNYPLTIIFSCIPYLSYFNYQN